MKNSFLFFLVLELFVSIVSVADDASFVQERDLFCRDPYAYLCKNPLKSKELDKERTNIVFRTLKRMFPDGTKLDGIETVFANALLTKKDGTLEVTVEQIPRILELLEKYSKELVLQLPIQEKEILVRAEGLKRLQSLAINDHKELAEELRNRMAQQVSQVTVVTADKFFSYWDANFADWRKDPQVAVVVFNEFVNYCGIDGMEDYLRHTAVRMSGPDDKNPKKELRYMLVCPGFLFSSLSDSEKGFPWLEFGLSHELGHANDVYRLPGVYTKLGRCLSDEFQDSKDLDWSKFAQRNRNQVFTSHLNEVVADIWGAETMSRRLAESKLTPKQRLGVTTTMLRSFCKSAEANESYPSHKFRLQFIATQNSLRNVIGCTERQTQIPACSINGKE